MKNVHIENELVALQNNMRNFAFSLTLNRDEAEDLLQDTTLKVLDNQEKFTDNVNFKGWVLTIMKSLSRSAIMRPTAAWSVRISKS